MIKISQRDFNWEMDSYLSTRKRGQPGKTRSRETCVQEKIDEQEFLEEEGTLSNKKPWHRKIVDTVFGEPNITKVTEPEKDEELEEEFDEFKEDVKKPKGGIFKHVVGWIFADDIPRKKESVQEATSDIKEPALGEDIKEVLKIQHKWLEKLSKKTIKEFRESDDYITYRTVLEKYNLIR